MAATHVLDEVRKRLGHTPGGVGGEEFKDLGCAQAGVECPAQRRLPQPVNRGPARRFEVRHQLQLGPHGRRKLSRGHHREIGLDDELGVDRRGGGGQQRHRGGDIAAHGQPPKPAQGVRGHHTEHLGFLHDPTGQNSRHRGAARPHRRRIPAGRGRQRGPIGRLAGLASGQLRQEQQPALPG